MLSPVHLLHAYANERYLPHKFSVTQQSVLTDEFLCEAKGSYFSTVHTGDSCWRNLCLTRLHTLIMKYGWINCRRKVNHVLLEANGADTSHFPRLTILNDLYSVCWFNLALVVVWLLLIPCRNPVCHHLMSFLYFYLQESDSTILSSSFPIYKMRIQRLSCNIFSLTERRNASG